MELSLAAGLAALVYIGFAFDFFGYLARDELRLRLLMLTASAFYVAYYWVGSAAPLWSAIATNAALALANLGMIAFVVAERTTLGMPAEAVRLYQLFPLMTPGQFRRLDRAGARRSADVPAVLTEAGVRPASVYFVTAGSVRVEKEGMHASIGPGGFIGEIAFLTHAPATATVVAWAGAEYMEWNAAALERLIARDPGLRVALLAHLNTDLARKVSNSAIRGTEAEQTAAKAIH